jgi:phosphohistidine phosphatase
MKLWLIRHAKSDWSSPGLSDFQRPLNARGLRDGPRMATWLAAQSDPATWIWSSDAERARRTAEFVADAFAVSPDRVIDDHRLYGAPPDTLLGVVRETPDEVPAAAVVAHNPGMTYLLNLLVGETVLDNLPTFGVARLNIPGRWLELGYGDARLELLTSPKRLTREDP